ncbi:lactam utilization protein B [Rhodococcus sp. 27YEA15]
MRDYRSYVRRSPDRGYTAAGTLVPRNEPGAVLHNPVAIAERVRAMVSTGQVEAVDGSTLRISADSICVHGDNPAAVASASAIRLLLEKSNIRITPFC